ISINTIWYVNVNSTVNFISTISSGIDRGIIALAENNISFLDMQNGKIVWCLNVSENNSEYVLIGDIDGDRSEELLFVNESDLIAVSFEGKTLWSYSLGTIQHYRFFLANLEEDNALEILVVVDSELLILNGTNGMTLSELELPLPISNDAAIGDLNNDNFIDLVIVSNNTLYAYDIEARKVIWQTNDKTYYYSKLSIGDIDGDKKPDIIVFNSDYLFVLNGLDGSAKWYFEIENPFFTPALGDLTGDLSHEIIFGGLYDLLQCIDNDGRLLWSVYPSAYDTFITTPIIVDINGDNRLDVLAITLRGFLYLIEGASGQLLTIYDLHDTAFINPIFIDIDNDKNLEMIAVTYPGEVFAFDFSTSIHRTYWQGPLGDFLGTKNAFLIDKDLDFLSDSSERFIGSDPLDYDTDDDGMPDGWEVFYGLDPCQSSDGSLDLDNDGLSNYAEYTKKTNPLKSDTDGDFLADNVDLWPRDTYQPAILIGYFLFVTVTFIAEYFYIRRKKTVNE
ncbi:MAG: FG-GAP-like repeat-containing protein, partial [Candidatus Njordarchaeum guaymaensis]